MCLGVPVGDRAVTNFGLWCQLGLNAYHLEDASVSSFSR